MAWASFAFDQDSARIENSGSLTNTYLTTQALFVDKQFATANLEFIFNNNNVSSTF